MTSKHLASMRQFMANKRFQPMRQRRARLKLGVRQAELSAGFIVFASIVVSKRTKPRLCFVPKSAGRLSGIIENYQVRFSG